MLSQNTFAYTKKSKNFLCNKIVNFLHIKPLVLLCPKNFSLRFFRIMKSFHFEYTFFAIKLYISSMLIDNFFLQSLQNLTTLYFFIFYSCFLIKCILMSMSFFYNFLTTCNFINAVDSYAHFFKSILHFFEQYVITLYYYFYVFIVFVHLIKSNINTLNSVAHFLGYLQNRRLKWLQNIQYNQP